MLHKKWMKGLVITHLLTLTLLSSVQAEEKSVTITPSEQVENSQVEGSQEQKNETRSKDVEKVQGASSEVESKPVEGDPSDLHLQVKSALMVEATTGKILYHYNEDKAFPPASMTKMMTELLVLESIKKGKIKWTDKVKTSEYGHFMAKYGGSRVFLAMGEERTVKELYEAMAIYSANDATVMLAEYLGGSESNFVGMMNQKAQDLGMKNSHFMTSSGFPIEDMKEFAPKEKGEHVMSARDAAILAREIINNYPEALNVAKTPKKVFREGESNELLMPNWNWMLPGLIYQFEGVDGLKTGHTDQAGYCFTGTIQKNGIRLITVVMGAESETKRFSETRRLMEYGLSQFKMKPMITKGQIFKGYEKAKLKKGVEKEVEVFAESSLSVPVSIESKEALKIQVNLKESISPIRKGQVLGVATIQYPKNHNEQFLREADSHVQVNLVASKEVEKASFVRLFFRSVGEFVGAVYTNLYGIIAK